MRSVLQTTKQTRQYLYASQDHISKLYSAEVVLGRLKGPLYSWNTIMSRRKWKEEGCSGYNATRAQSSPVTNTIAWEYKH